MTRKNSLHPDLEPVLAAIEMVVLDVDGVLTDGRIIYSGTGEEMKNFHVRDGLGMALARKAGIVLAIVSGRKSPVTTYRAAELKIDLVFQGPRPKDEVVRELSKSQSIPLKRMAFIGDDLIDVPAMNIVGFPVAVQDAHLSALEAARFVTTLRGGEGAVRETLDLILSFRQ